MNEKFEKKALALAIAVCIVIPLINCLGLQWVYTFFIEGNYRFVGFDTLLGNFIEFVRNVALFSGYAIMIFIIFAGEKKDGRKFTFIRGITLIVPYLCAVAVLLLTSPKAISLLPYMSLYSAVNLLLDLVVFVAVALIAKAEAKQSDMTSVRYGISPKTNLLTRTYLLTCTVFALFSIMRNVITTVSLVSESGAPSGFSEIWTLAEPFVETVVYFIAEFIIMLITANKLEEDLIKCQESVNSEN